MKQRNSIIQNPQVLGIACAAGAVALGLAWLAAAGAPWHYLVINTAAFLIGLVLLKLAGLLQPQIQRMHAATLLLIPAALFATALLGQQLEGVARWLRIGAISIQPSFLLLPILTLAFARSRNAATASALLLAAAAMALQPDRAMAGALLASLAVLALMQPDRLSLAAVAGSLIAMIATLLQPDTLAPVPYVEQVLTSAFAVHLLAGAAVITGSALLLVPSLHGWRHDPGNRALHAVFGTFWLATIAAAVIGNYPTPLLGYGGSAIIGYLLSLALLPRHAGARSWQVQPSNGADNTGPGGRLPRVNPEAAPHVAWQ
jgi:cell division protein FtsW (lipid II flippase)